MKTIQSVKKEMEAITNKYGNGFGEPIKKKGITEARRRYSFLTMVLRYLEYSPEEEAIIRDRDKVKKKLQLIEERYNVWKENNPVYVSRVKDPRAVWGRINDEDQNAKYLETLNFILSE
jgi:hypothetical protein